MFTYGDDAGTGKGQDVLTFVIYDGLEQWARTEVGTGLGTQLRWLPGERHRILVLVTLASLTDTL